MMMLMLLLWELVLHLLLLVVVHAHVYLNEFAVKINAGNADEIAAKHGFVNRGKIGELDGYYLFEHNHVSKRSTSFNHTHYSNLKNEKQVEWVEQQVVLKRLKRDFLYPELQYKPGIGYPLPSYSRMPYRSPEFYTGQFKDPLYPEQWYLHQGAANGWDMNVKKAWHMGYTGKGVVISILDDGIQTNHPDLVQNYDPRASYDINGNDEDPMPQDNGDNKHGTRCAGEVSATANNNYCGVGIAFNSSIGGVRMLDGTVNDAVEAKALSLNRNHIDIYSASWGPEDDGRTVDGPGPLAKVAFTEGVAQGRSRKGSIFVWASGNGGRHTDNCNCDGYTNSIYTLSISSATQRGLKPWYLEECSSTLATTYSSGTPGHDKNIVTVDMNASLNPQTMCTRDHTGTSASAPIAAAICALALEANPGLTWRDMQYLVVLTSRPEPLDKEDGWITNGVARKVSHKFGYGLMDGEGMVKLAGQWESVPPQHVCETSVDSYQRMISKDFGGRLEVFMDTNACQNSADNVVYLEHVQCKISLKFNPRGNLKIMLESPLGTRSVLLFPRPRDLYQSEFLDWPFLSVHFWGEKAAGRWKLTVINAGTGIVQEPGILLRWSLVLHGTDQDPIRLHSKRPQDPYEFAASSQNVGSVTMMQVRDDSKINKECHGECSGGCHGKGAEHCKNCRHFQTEDEPKMCVKSCSEGQYADEHNTCKKCDPSCKSCTDSDSTSCQSCIDGLLYIEGLNECKSQCPSSYYANTMQHTCYPCNTVCTTCTGRADNCTSCRAGLVAYDTQCLAACPKKSYESSDHRCQPCHELCETCMGPSSYECVTCPSNLVHVNGTCLNSCPSGYYSASAINECYSCEPSCSTCNSTHCLTCHDGWQLDYNGRCHLVTKCNTGEYHLNDECVRCHGSCATCDGPSYADCLSCSSDKLLYKQTCLTNCPSNTFVITSKQECISCHETCATCTGPEADQCISCKEGLFLRDKMCSTVCGNGKYPKDGSCHSCHQTCATCSGEGELNCITCIPNLQLGSGKCQDNCPIGLFPLNGTCQPCHHTCYSCKGDGLHDCLACKRNFVLDHGICIECNKGQFYNPVTEKCEPCDQSCTSCMGPDTDSCTSCTQPLKHDPINHRCVPCCLDTVHDGCCRCDTRTGICITSPITDKRRINGYDEDVNKLASSYFPYHTFWIVAVLTCMIAIASGFLIMKACQMKGGRRMWWKHDYQRLPMRYEASVDTIEVSKDDLWIDEHVKT